MSDYLEVKQPVVTPPADPGIVEGAPANPLDIPREDHQGHRKDVSLNTSEYLGMQTEGGKK